MSTAATDGTGAAAADGSDSTRIDGINSNGDASALAPTEGSETSPQNGQQHANGDNLAPAAGDKESDDGPQGGLDGSETDSGAPTKKKQPRKTPPAKKSTVVSALDALSKLPAQFLAKSDELVSQDKALYGQVAWARVRGYPYWPGYICDPQMLVNDYVSMQKYLPLMDTHVWVYFYQTNNSAPVLRSDIALWDDTSKPFHEGFPTKKGKPYKNAKFDEAKEIAQKEFQLPIEKRVSWVVVKVLDKETTGEKMARKRKEGAAAKRPAVDQPLEAEPAKKRRGRPPKNVDAPVAKLDDVVDATPVDVAPAPKKRGRPPKAKPQPAEAPSTEQEEPQPAVSPADAAPSTPVKAKGRPGRKPKGKVAVDELPSTAEQDVDATVEHGDDATVDQTEEVNDPAAQDPKRQRGRPPKDVTPKRRGRPPKERAVDALRLDDEAPPEVANDDGSADATDHAPAAADKLDDQPVDEAAPHKPDSDAADIPQADVDATKSQRKRPAASDKGTKARAKKAKASQEEQGEAEQTEAAPNDSATSAENELPGSVEATEAALVIETLDLEQAISLAKDLQGCVKGESKESVALALKIMNALIECSQFTLETLQKSGLPAVVNQLRNTSINPNVKKTASALRKHMIRQSGYEKPKPPPVSVEPSAASVEDEAPEPAQESAPAIEPSAAVADTQPGLPVGDQEADHHTTPEGDDGAPAVPFGRDRAIVVEMIQAVITSPKVSREIEKGLFDRFLATTEEYKSQARRVIFGLRDHDLCRQKVLSGSLHILELVFATDEAFTQYNLAAWKAK